MKITFLGTSSMVPTAKRNHISIFLEYEDEGILVDCGEGTQRQFKKAKIRPTKITRLLITHWDGDHTLGIPGLIQTLAGDEYSKTLKIYGPKGTKERLKELLKIFFTDKLKMEVFEVKEGIVAETEKFKIEARKLEHRPLTYGYAFIEKDKRKIDISYLKRKHGLGSHPVLKDLKLGKAIVWKGKKITPKEATYVEEGKKVAFVFDTKYCENAVQLAKNADIAIAEATFSKEFQKKAGEYYHMTSVDAAKLAKKAKAKKLVLTHFSQRYKDVSQILAEAKAIFKNTEAAEDMMQIKL